MFCRFVTYATVFITKKSAQQQSSMVSHIYSKPSKTTYVNSFWVHDILDKVWNNVACNLRKRCNMRNQFAKWAVYLGGPISS